MGMFDYYRPAAEQRCPVCGRLLLEWQGTDGPTGQFVWVETMAFPIDQLVDEEVQLLQADREQLRLPALFMIYSHDCPDHNPIVADGKAPEGIWTETTMRPFSPQNKPRKERPPK